MTDEDLHQRISQLSEEEHALRRAHSDGSGLSREEQERLQSLEVELDRTWDLLRQREARRNAGLDPNEARERDAETVENYLN